MKSDIITLASESKAHVLLGPLDQRKCIHICKEKNELGREIYVVLSPALVGMYAKCGCIYRGVNLCAKKKDVILCNSTLVGLLCHDWLG